MLARCFSLSIALGLLGCRTLQPMAGSSPELRQQIAAGQLRSPGDRVVITAADGQGHRLVAVAADSAIVRGKHDSVPTNQIDFVQKSQVNISVHGRQANAVTPWAGVDAIVVASQVVLGLQTIVSRQTQLIEAPAVISVMEIHGGAFLTVPENAQITVLVQTFDPKTRLDVIARIKRTAENIAASAGATAETLVIPGMHAPAVYNDPKLVARMLPTLRRVAGDGLLEIPPQPFGDDFSFFQEKVPGFLLLIGARKSGDEFIPNHSPRFKLDEASFEIGVRTLANLSVDYMLEAR